MAPAASSNPDTIEHKTGATDILLRYEEGGGFMMPAFTAAAVPHFTLYGDGTVIFRNPMVEVPPAEGSVFKMNPLRTAKLSEAQIQELLLLALSEGGLAVARPNYTNDMIADASTAVFTIEAGGIKKVVSVYALGLEMEGVADPRRAPRSRSSPIASPTSTRAARSRPTSTSPWPTAVCCSKPPASKPPTYESGPGPT